jgi:hypothetical protein
MKCLRIVTIWIGAGDRETRNVPSAFRPFIPMTTVQMAMSTQFSSGKLSKCLSNITGTIMIALAMFERHFESSPLEN